MMKSVDRQDLIQFFRRNEFAHQHFISPSDAAFDRFIVDLGKTEGAKRVIDAGGHGLIGVDQRSIQIEYDQFDLKHWEDNQQSTDGFSSGGASKPIHEDNAGCTARSAA